MTLDNIFCSGRDIDANSTFYTTLTATTISRSYLTRSCPMRFVIHGWGQNAFDVNHIGTELNKVNLLTYCFGNFPLMIRPVLQTVK